MEITASRAVPRSLPRRLAGRFDSPALAAWTLPFTVVAYLALSNGGYDTIVRSQVGIAVWWIVLLGALAGVLPARIGAAGWVAIALLAGFTTWTGLATGWSESAERTVIELGRVAAYLGVLVLAVSLQGRAAARHTINGLACAIGLVTLLAVLSRLHPQWFPVNDQIEFLGAGAARKLSYPLNYWNALACFAAMGVPLLLGVALGARTFVGQALAATTLPLSALCVYLTISRGGTLALAVGILVFLIFVPRRLDALGTLLVAGIGSAILVSAASQRDALQDGVPTAPAIHQGMQLIWLAMIVCGGAALLQVAMALATRHVRRPAWLAPGRGGVAVRSLLVVAVVCVAGLAVGVPGYAQARWEEFKAPVGAVAAGAQDNVFSRLSAANGNGRYEFWQSARHANETSPLRGIGPGTFEFWWARHGTTAGFIRDAHSLYFETLAETGTVGFAMLIGLLLFLLGATVARSLRAPPDVRVWIAAAVGGLVVFMTSAAFEWAWEIGAIASAVMVLGAVIVVGRGDADAATSSAHPEGPRPLPSRMILALIAAAAIGAVGVPMVGALAMRGSRDAIADGRPDVALQESDIAARLQPYAATPHLQRALVLEQSGALPAAAMAARAATVDEPTNWRTWFVLSRVQARRGEQVAAGIALRKAQHLNRRSPLLGAR
jgi:hypothetical protein